MTKRDRYQFDDDQDQTAPSALKVTQGDVFPGSPPPPPVPFRRPQGGAILKEGQLTVGAFTLTESGLEIASNASHDDWGKVGELLFKLEGSIQWLIGDWLVYGEKLEYGDLIARVEATGRHYDTVRNYMVVCREFELSRRRYNLSFGHYQAATSLDPETQDEALAYAENNKLSVAAFRKMIQVHQAPRPTLPASQLVDPSGGLTPLPSEQKAKQLYQRVEGDAQRLKPKERAELEEYVQQGRQHFDEIERWLKGER